MAAHFHLESHGFEEMKRLLKNWHKQSQLIKTSYVKAGLLGPQAEKKHKPSKHHDEKEKRSAADIVQIGLYHEFGAPAAHIPERSFIRSSFNAHLPEYRRMIHQMLPQIFEGKGLDVKKALNLLGAKMAADMKATIKAGIAPALKRHLTQRQLTTAINSIFGYESDNEARGAESIEDGRTPLIDTGQMINSITWLVVLGADGSGEHEGAHH